MGLSRKLTGMGHSLNADDRLYRRIVESATAYAMVTTDLRGKISSWNRGAELLFGYRLKEILGKDICLIFTADDRQNNRPFTEMHIALAKGSADDDRWHVRKNNTQVWVTGQMMPLLDDDEIVVGFIKVMRDATKSLQQEEAVKASQERLQLILESAIDYAIFTFDADGSIISWNTGAQKIFGYNEQEIANRDARILFAPERAEGALEWEMQTALQDGRAENDRFHVRKDGSTFWGSGLTMPLRAHKDKPGYLKVLRDDTERHNAEKHQQILNKEMNHRVKNSLAQITGMLAMQARASGSLEVKRVLDDAKARVATIAQVHDHLWRQPHGETVDLADFLTQLCERMGGASSHRFLVECHSCVIDTDRALQVALLVNELITNAVKYAYTDGTGDILLKLTCACDEICLVVRDHGIGLPKDFDARHYSGKSLGMKLLGVLVRQLKAKLTTEDGEPGAIFTITIPLKV